MKKIISLILAVMMLSAMMVTANAMNKDGSLTFRSDVTEVTVGDEFTVYLYVTADSAGDAGLKQTTFKYSYTDAASFVSATAEGYLAAGYANISTIDGQVTIMDTNKANWTTESGDFVAITFLAEKAGDFTITNTSNNTQFQLIASTTKNTIRGAVAPLTITVKEEASAFVPETIKGDAIAATATDIVLPKSEGSENTHRFTNVAIFNAEIGAAVKYSETGFIWVANGDETENKFTLDGEAISGGGTFAYSVIMAGIPDDVTITAKPYYVTAE